MLDLTGIQILGFKKRRLANLAEKKKPDDFGEYSSEEKFRWLLLQVTRDSWRPNILTNFASYSE